MIFPPPLSWHALLYAALLSVFCVASAIPALGQTTLIGRIHDEHESPVPGANVLLLRAADSSLVQGAVTTGDGRFAIEAVAAGTYRLRVSFVGFTEHLSAPFVLNGAARRDVGTISLRPGDILLDGVLVEARRSLFEQRSDRLIVNVGSSVTLAGTDALTVLKRSPGVVVSEQSGTISLIGKRGVQVMVNDRLTNVPPDALMQYLAGLSADAIERIELITAPPASMDAEGDAGFINIVLKRSPEDGLRGTASLSGGYGEGEVGSASTNLSVRRGALRAVGNYSFSWNDRNTTMTNARRVDDGGGILTTRSFSNRDPLQRNHNARLGLDVDLSDRTAVGAVVAGYDHRWTMDASTTQRILRDGAQARRTTIENGEVNHWQHLMGNVHIEHHLAAGGTLRADADYLYYRNDNPNDFTIRLRDGGGDPGAPEDAATRKTTPFRIGVVKADYNRSLRSTWTLGTGVKASFARFTNDVQLERLLPDVPLGDASPAEDSRLTEDVFAAYLESDVQV
ncbi:MAG: outer membrane beta-barrel protein, partial [Bacteroidetes bacterium]|nr:outer membrane beta-barrel protein [Bacteroidota bacterium]